MARGVILRSTHLVASILRGVFERKWAALRTRMISSRRSAAAVLGDYYLKRLEKDLAIARLGQFPMPRGWSSRPPKSGKATDVKRMGLNDRPGRSSVLASLPSSTAASGAETGCGDISALWTSCGKVAIL
jgi:hypothetical protein